MSNELWRRGAVELAGMIARKEVSSREVVVAHLARIDEVNPYLNAVVRRWDADSLAAADAADAAVVPVGMADGMPVGAQLVGRRFADLTCLNAAQQLEDLFGTITPIDPVH